MPDQRSTTSRIFGIYLTALVVAGMLLLYGVHMVNQLREAKSAWQAVQVDAGSTMHGLHTLLARFGIGGFIDKYRRYQQRPDPALLEGMQADLDGIGHAVHMLDHKHLGEEGKKAVAVLREAITRYSHNIAILQAQAVHGGHTLGQGQGQGQGLLPVDEEQAVWAIGVLSHHAMHEGDEHLSEADQALSGVISLIYLGLVLVVPVFLVALLLAHQRRRLAAANRAVAESNSYLQNLLEATPDALLIVDSQGRVREVNHAAVDVFGHCREVLCGMTVEDLMPPRYRPGHAAIRSQAFKASQPRPFSMGKEFFILNLAGEEVPVDISLGYVEAKGERLAIMALRDISERKQMEGLLRERQEALETAQSIAHIGSWVWDVQPDTLSWSDEIYRIFGHDPQVFAPTYGAFMEHVHPDDRVRVGAGVAKTLLDDTPYEMEHRVIRPGGEERIVVEKGRLTRDADGEPLRMVGTVWDITERKQAELELLFDQAIIEGMSQPVVVVDQQGRIEDVNPAYCEMSGYGRDELIGQPSNKLRSGKHDKAYYENLWDNLESVGKWQGEIWIRRKDGAIVPRLLSITTICEQEHEHCRYVGFYSDITSLKENEAKLEKLAHFDPLTGLANRMLFHDRLRAAIARARRSNSQVAVLFVDLDGFKGVNDALGHRTGDLLLVEVAERMKACVREDDTVARLGGDEFALVLNEVASRDAVEVLLGRLQEQLQITLGSGAETLHVSASIGIALYPEHGEAVSLLLEKADQAMYQAKQAGKNAFVFYDPDSGEEEA